MCTNFRFWFLITFPLPTAIIYCPIKFGADTFIIIIIIIIKYIYIAQDREKLQMQWVDTFICCAAAEILPFYKIHLDLLGEPRDHQRRHIHGA